MSANISTGGVVFGIAYNVIKLQILKRGEVLDVEPWF